MKTFLKECVLVLLMLLVSCAAVSQVHASNSFTLPFKHTDEGIKHLPTIGIETQTRDGQQVSVGTGAAAFDIIVGNVGSFLSLVLGIIAIGALFVAGYQLVTAQSAVSEEIEKQKMNVVYVLLGLIVFALGGSFVNDFLFFGEGAYIALEEGETLQQGITQALGIGTRTLNQIRRLLNLFLGFSGAGAILVLVIAGIRLIINPGSDEMIDKQKKLVGYTAVGIIMIGLADTVVNRIVFPVSSTTGRIEYLDSEGVLRSGINVGLLEVQLQGLSNYVLGFLGVAVFVTFVVCGLMMVVYFGNDEMITKVKSTMKNVVIGSLVAFSAYTVVATLLRTFLAARDGAVVSMVMSFLG